MSDADPDIFQSGGGGGGGEHFGKNYMFTHIISEYQYTHNN